MNLFDGLQNVVFDVVTSTMGYPANWKPSIDAEPLTGQVLFNDPTDNKDQVGEQSYVSPNPQVEYKQGLFPGLYEAIRSTNGGQTITVNGINYVALTAQKKYDGNTIIIDVARAEE